MKKYLGLVIFYPGKEMGLAYLGEGLEVFCEGDKGGPAMGRLVEFNMGEKELSMVFLQKKEIIFSI